MSVAEKLFAQGEAKGEARGLWVGKIQAVEEFLELKISSPEDLSCLSIEALTERHQSLHHAYELRFTRG